MQTGMEFALRTVNLGQVPVLSRVLVFSSVNLGNGLIGLLENQERKMSTQALWGPDKQPLGRPQRRRPHSPKAGSLP